MIAQRLKQVNSTARELYLNETAAVFFFFFKGKCSLFKTVWETVYIPSLGESHVY